MQPQYDYWSCLPQPLPFTAVGSTPPAYELRGRAPARLLFRPFVKSPIDANPRCRRTNIVVQRGMSSTCFITCPTSPGRSVRSAESPRSVSCPAGRA